MAVKEAPMVQNHTKKMGERSVALCGCEDTASKLLEYFSKSLSGSSDGSTPSAPVQSGHQQRNKNMIQMTLKRAC